MKVPSLIKDPPNHRHALARPYFHPNITSVLDVGGLSFKKVDGKWIRHVGAPKEVWGVAHILDKTAKKPHIFTINVEADYDHNDRKPDMYYDGLHIPFADSSYDIVTSIDVFEHIPRSERKQVLSEIIRVAKQKVIIVVPFFCAENVKMEEDILADMERKNIQPKPSIFEHRRYELPKISDFEQYFKDHKVAFELSYGTPRSIMKQYYFFQNSINALLNISGTTKESVAAFLTIIMDTAGNIFNMHGKVEKKDAYRAIISITK